MLIVSLQVIPFGTLQKMAENDDLTRCDTLEKVRTHTNLFLDPPIGREKNNILFVKNVKIDTKM